MRATMTAGAVTFYRQTLEMAQRIYKGADHPSVATSMGNLASALESSGDAAVAVPLHRQTLLVATGMTSTYFHT